MVLIKTLLIIITYNAKTNLRTMIHTIKFKSDKKEENVWLASFTEYGYGKCDVCVDITRSECAFFCFLKRMSMKSENGATLVILLM